MRAGPEVWGNADMHALIRVVEDESYLMSVDRLVPDADPASSAFHARPMAAKRRLLRRLGLPLGCWLSTMHQGRGRYSLCRLYPGTEQLARAARCGSSRLVTKMSSLVGALNPEQARMEVLSVEATHVKFV